MPITQTTLGAMNMRFGNDNIGEVPAELFEPGTSLGRAAEALGVNQAGFSDWVERVPDGVQEAIRATVYSALTRERRSAITFAWAPAFDYEVSIWDVAATSKTPGGITILLKSAYDR